MTDDTISRVSALEGVKGLCEGCYISEHCGQCSPRCNVRIMRETLENLPSATDTNVGTKDTISRQAAVSGISDLLMLKLKGERLPTYNEVYHAIHDLPSAQPGWIPVTERLPDVRQWVLCQCRAGIMDVLRLTADGSWNKNYPHTEYMSGFVVAWMPLPKRYEG